MKKVLLFASLLMASVSVSAATLSGFSSGTFNNTVGQNATSTFSGDGTNTLKWGVPSAGHKQSSLQYSNYPGGFNNVPVDTNFIVGSFFYHNGTQTANTGAASTNFELKVNFNTPFSKTFESIYDFTIDNTNNPDGDSVLLVGGTPAAEYITTYAGKNYYFTLLGFQEWRNGQLVGTLGDFIFAQEGRDVIYKLIGQITTSEVPLPAAVWLFGSGLLGFMAIRRRAKAQQAA